MCCRLISHVRGISADSLTFSDRIMAGATAGLIQSPLRQAMDRIKSVMQVSNSTANRPSYRWSGACAVDLVRREGWRRGLFHGMSSVVLRDVAQFALYFATYDDIKSVLENVRLDNVRAACYLH